jgi:hypothetical protein
MSRYEEGLKICLHLANPVMLAVAPGLLGAMVKESV